jgi:hypothetical protein
VVHPLVFLSQSRFNAWHAVSSPTMSASGSAATRGGCLG